MHPDEILAEAEEIYRAGAAAVDLLVARYGERLHRLIAFRLDPRLARRVDPMDVLQETWMRVSQRLGEYLAAPTVPIFVWLRQLGLQVLVEVNRRHLAADKRSVLQEADFYQGGPYGGTSISLAQVLAGPLTSPSQAAIREERLEALRRALDAMDEIDREVLALRHFEELSNNEVAAVLGLSVKAASARYVRALGRLRELMQGY